MADPRLTALQAFLKDHPSIKCTTPSSADYASIRKLFNASRRDTPLAIVHPQSVADVSALVKYAKSQNIKVTVRVGGHHLEGKAIIEDTLTIDLRALTSVKIAADRQSVTIEGGILQGDLATKLASEGLVTPICSFGSVGYVGWAVYGGYGPFSSHWGLGADQIIGATIVNGEGDIIKADDSILKGMRGGGGVFGVIVDVTIKTYSLKAILAGAIMFDSQDIVQAFENFNFAYQSMMRDGLPLELTVQQLVFNTPPGRVFGVSVVWSSEDIEEGKHWIDKIASLGTVVMNTVVTSSIPDWLKSMENVVPSTVYGSSRTRNLHRITPEVAKVVSERIAKMPSYPTTMFSIHQLRGPSATQNGHSVFASREPHYMLEILGYGTSEENMEEAEKWADDFSNAVEETNTDNILQTTYISLDETDKAKLTRMFGPHAQEVAAFREKYDPEHVFKAIVPLE